MVDWWFRVLTVGGMELFPICKLLQDLLTTVNAVSSTHDLFFLQLL